MAIHKDLTGEAAYHQVGWVQTSDPGAVGAGKVWVDTNATPATIKVRNSANSAWLATSDVAALAAHLADSGDAHDASAISVLDTGGNFTGTDVEAVLAELYAAIVAGGSVTDLEGLSDVDLTSPATRQGLFYDGTNFVNQYEPGHFVAPVSVSATGTVGGATHTELVDASGGARTRTLPTAIGIAGKRFCFVKVDTSANVVALQTTSSQTINGAAPPWNIRYGTESLTIESDGANWNIVGMRVLPNLDDLHDVSATSPSADDLLQFDGTNWVAVDPATVTTAGGGGSSYRTLVTLGTNRTNATTTLADVTGLSVPITSGTTYRFEFLMKIETTTSGGGWKLRMMTPNTLDDIVIEMVIWSASNAVIRVQQMAAQQTGSNSTFVTSPALAVMRGIITPVATGTLQPQFAAASTTGSPTLTVHAGSTAEYW